MFGFFNRRRRRTLWEEPLPSTWTPLLREASPLFRRMPKDLQEELLKHGRVFLAEKHFEGCNGLALTEEMRMILATHACLPMLGRDFDYFPYLQTVLVYPEAFVVEHEREDEYGIVDAEPDVLEGESWHSGAVIFSWEDVAYDLSALDGRNVIVHEMAHQVHDHEDLTLDTPEATAQFHDILADEFETHVDRVSRRKKTLIDPYGAEDPAEFFSVISEAFYESPAALRDGHPGLYAGLRAFYGVDPEGWK